MGVSRANETQIDIDARRPFDRRIVRALSALNRPAVIAQALWRRYPNGPFDLLCDLDIYARPAYAYGIQQGVRLARRLGIEAISAIEFGVAGGQGLLAMEELAARAEAASGVHVEVYGFDSGGGLPPPADYRDLPYKWQGGSYRMDVPALEARLQRARLVLGPVASTAQSFIQQYHPAPIGFISFDLDYYSSTADALDLLAAGHESFLPRVLCYFDNTISGNNYVHHNPFAGELLAIEEFNRDHADMKIAPIHGLAHKRAISSSWNDTMYSLHRFLHPQYNEYVGPPGPQELTI